MIFLAAKSKLNVQLMGIGLVLTGALGFPAHSHANDLAYAEAVAQYRSGRMSDAYGRFIMLAEAGDSDAARIVLFMHQFGPTLYASHWDAHPADLEYWTYLAKQRSTRPDAVFRPEGYVPMGTRLKIKSKASKKKIGPQ